jgi:hypothetical protein
VQEARRQGQGAVTVYLRAGVYYLDKPLTLEPADSGAPGEPVLYAAYPGERVTLSGGRKLECDWRPYRDGIWQCHLPDVESGALNFTQLFVNGRRQTRARYPNADPSEPRRYTGYLQAAGAVGEELADPLPGDDDDMTFSGGSARGVRFDPANFSPRVWSRPEEAVIHIYQAHYWGNLQWQIKAVDRAQQVLWFGAGGQQLGAQWHANPGVVDERSRFFVENVFEELDAPGEWYLERTTGLLYFMPPQDMDLNTALIEVPVLQQVVQLVGSQADPVHDISFVGFRITHTVSTFLEPYDVPSLSDWSIHRGGAIWLEGARNCRVEQCWFDAVGGNALFMNGYNRGNIVTGCKFTHAGDSAICFVGQRERTTGTQRSFPYECQATNNLVYECGIFGKQVAGVYISRAKRITAAHNHIHTMPRAGICIGDGTWGGHLIEYNYIHDTCRETGDHGPFNAWGRDKYWCLVQSHMPYTAGRSHDAGHVKVDAMEPVILRHNHFREQSGWGLDLDDGASNYEIYNNLCAGVSIKLREGAHRTIYNNIWVNGANSPCFHVGNEQNHDRFFRNITIMQTGNMQAEDDLNFAMGKGYGEIYTLIAPPARGPWLAEMDYNCFYSDRGEFVARVQQRGEDDSWRYSLQVGEKYTLEEWQALGFDRHSIFADPDFIDPEHGDYRVRPGSPALQLGFENFDSREAGLLPTFVEPWAQPTPLYS